MRGYRKMSKSDSNLQSLRDYGYLEISKEFKDLIDKAPDSILIAPLEEDLKTMGDEWLKNAEKIYFLAKSAHLSSNYKTILLRTAQLYIDENINLFFNMSKLSQIRALKAINWFMWSQSSYLNFLLSIVNLCKVEFPDLSNLRALPHSHSDFTSKKNLDEVCIEKIDKSATYIAKFELLNTHKESLLILAPKHIESPVEFLIVGLSLLSIHYGEEKIIEVASKASELNIQIDLQLLMRLLKFWDTELLKEYPLDWIIDLRILNAYPLFEIEY